MVIREFIKELSLKKVKISLICSLCLRKNKYTTFLWSSFLTHEKGKMAIYKKTSVGHAWPPMTPVGHRRNPTALYGSRMVPWLHILTASDEIIVAIGSHRGQCMANTSFQCLVLYIQKKVVSKPVII